jgi:hypothetical protein
MRIIHHRPLRRDELIHGGSLAWLDMDCEANRTIERTQASASAKTDEINESISGILHNLKDNVATKLNIRTQDGKAASIRRQHSE